MDEKLRQDRFQNGTGAAADRRTVVFASGKKILTDPIACAAERADADEQAGSLLADLERRQDDVLAQLDELDRRVSDLLRGLGVTLIDDSEAIKFADTSDEENESDRPVEAATPKLPDSGLTERVAESAVDQEVVEEITVGFSKLPQGDNKSRRGKRGKAAFTEPATWDQNSRAA
jgi:hypothetical protein